MSLWHPVDVELVFYDLLLDDLLRKFKLVYTVDEVLFWEIVTRASGADTFYSLTPEVKILHDFLQTKELVLA